MLLLFYKNAAQDRVVRLHRGRSTFTAKRKKRKARRKKTGQTSGKSIKEEKSEGRSKLRT